MKMPLAPSTSPASCAAVSASSVDQQCPRGHLGHVEHRADLAGDLGLDVVALVEHQRQVRARVETAAADHLEHDAEELERVGRTDDQVVVGVEAGVEVERAQLSQPQQLRDDELDVGARGVVAGVQAHLGALTERAHLGVGRAPVRHVGHVHRRLEELVLQHHSLVGRRCAGRSSASDSASRSWRPRMSPWPG